MLNRHITFTPSIRAFSESQSREPKNKEAQMKNYLLLGTLLMWAFGAFAQQSRTNWTLRECVEYATSHNITIQQTDLTLQSLNEDKRAGWGAFLPNLNGWGNYGYSKGFSFDPLSNERIESEINQTAFGVQSQMDIFTGLQNLNAYRAAQMSYMAGKYNLEKIKNDIALNVANAYLQALANKEFVKAAESQKSISEGQVDRIDKLVKAGAAAEGDLFEVQATLAQDERNLVNAENNLVMSLLSLKQLLQLDDREFDIAEAEYDLPQINMENVNPFEIYAKALAGMPEIEKAHYDILAAERNLSRAKGLFSPRFGMSYNWSNRFVFSPLPRFEGVPFSVSDQLSRNSNHQFGVSMNIPIFNRMNTQTQVRQARIRLEQTRLDMELRKQELLQAVESAYTDATTSYTSYLASERAITANQEALKYAEQRFAVGTMNSYDFENAKNRLLSSQADMLRSKYDFIFKLKVLDFYLNQKLSY